MSLAKRGDERKGQGRIDQRARWKTRPLFVALAVCSSTAIKERLARVSGLASGSQHRDADADDDNHEPNDERNRLRKGEPQGCIQRICTGSGERNPKRDDDVR